MSIQVKHRKIIEDESDSQYEDYIDDDQEERTKYINNNLCKLPIHEHLQKLNLNGVMIDFDVGSLYPSAMSDEKSFHPKMKLDLLLNLT